MCPGVVTVKNADPRAPVSVGVTNLHRALCITPCLVSKWVTDMSPSSLKAVACGVPKRRRTGTKCLFSHQLGPSVNASKMSFLFAPKHCEQMLNNRANSFHEAAKLCLSTRTREEVWALEQTPSMKQQSCACPHEHERKCGHSYPRACSTSLEESRGWPA